MLYIGTMIELCDKQQRLVDEKTQIIITTRFDFTYNRFEKKMGNITATWFQHTRHVLNIAKSGRRIS